MKSSCSDTRNGFADDVQNAADTATNEFRRFVNEVEELFKATTTMTGDDLANAKQKLGERIEAAKESAEEFGDSMMNKAKKSVASTSQYVHDHSWAVVGASVAGSLLLGYMMSRRTN